MVEYELDPGVAVPAALLTPTKNDQSPIVAAAQEQLADSFVQEVDNFLTQPTTANDDAAVNNSYKDSLIRANEQYRSLFGEEPFTRETLRATVEAQSPN